MSKGQAESPYLLYMTFFLIASNIMMYLYSASACQSPINDISYTNYSFNNSADYNAYVESIKNNTDCSQKTIPTWFYILFNGSVIGVLALTTWHYGKPIG